MTWWESTPSSQLELSERQRYGWLVLSRVRTRKPSVSIRATTSGSLWSDSRPELRRITHHVAQNIQARRSSAIDGRAVRHSGYAQSINARRGIEKVFGWIKQWGGLRQFKVRGTEKVGAVFGLHVIAYNLIRLGNLLKPAMATV